MELSEVWPNLFLDILLLCFTGIHCTPMTQRLLIVCYCLLPADWAELSHVLEGSWQFCWDLPHCLIDTLLCISMHDWKPDTAVPSWDQRSNKCWRSRAVSDSHCSPLGVDRTWWSAVMWSFSYLCSKSSITQIFQHGGECVFFFSETDTSP